MHTAPCVIELECAECLPDNMPLVTSHRAANGSLRLADGDALQLSCGAGRFLAAPTAAALAARCRAGRYVALGRLLHLRELGCQQSIFEDVLHQVSNSLRYLYSLRLRLYGYVSQTSFSKLFHRSLRGNGF